MSFPPWRQTFFHVHRLNPDIPDLCIKCTEEIGTLYHCMWECRKLQVFWREILELISKLTDSVVPIAAKMCLLHIYPEDFLANTKKHKLINFCLLQAKRVIALTWKDTQRPDSRQWVKKMSCSLALEKLTYIVKGKVEDFYEIWTPFLIFMNNMNIQMPGNR